MKVAICFDKGRVFQHFGHTKEFKIYEIKNNEVTDFYYVSVQGEGCGCGALVPILQANHVNVVICGGLGEGAYNHLTESGIIVLSGVQGEVDDVIGQFIDETLEYDEKPNYSHHDGEHECHHDHESKNDSCCCHDEDEGNN